MIFLNVKLKIMNKLTYLFLLIVIIGCSGGDSNNSGNDTNVVDNPIYLDVNGITIKSREWGRTGDTGVVNGVEYTIVGQGILRRMINDKEDVTRVCTSRIGNMDNFFKEEVDFNQDIGSWDVSNVTSMTGMFAVSGFNQDIGNWDVSNVTSMNSMFGSSRYFNQDIGNWDVSNVKKMWFMFGYATSFNQDLSSWNVSNVTSYNSFSDGTPQWTLPKPNF